MSAFRTVFKNRHVILPAIRVKSAKQTLRNVLMAREAGCDGVFLINHEISYYRLLEIYYAVSAELGGWWIGVNCLDLSPGRVFRNISEGTAGVWVDNAGIDERSEIQEAAQRIQAARAESGWKGLYFGGVAFKYQRPVEDVEGAAQIASYYMDVVTTSGPGSGQAPSLGKMTAMRNALGPFPLAIASGMTPENVKDYLDVTDCFIVARGISKSSGELDPERIRAFVTVIRTYGAGER